MLNLHWKLKRSFSAPSANTRPCRLKSDSAPPGAIWTQFKPKLSNQKAILTRLGAISALDWPWFKGAKLDSKIRLHFNHRKAPFLGLKQIFPINSLWSSGYYIAQNAPPPCLFDLFGWNRRITVVRQPNHEKTTNQSSVPSYPSLISRYYNTVGKNKKSENTIRFV